MTRTSDRTRVADFIDAAEDLLGSTAQKIGGHVEVVDGVLVADGLRYRTHLGEIIVSASPTEAPMLFDIDHKPVSTYTPESDLTALSSDAHAAPMSATAQRMVNPYRGAAWARWRLAQTWDYFTEMVTVGKAVSLLCAGVVLMTASMILSLILIHLFPASFSLLQLNNITAVALIMITTLLLMVGASFRERVFRVAMADLRTLGATYVSGFDLSTPHDIVRSQITELDKESKLYFQDSTTGRSIRAHLGALRLFDETIMGSAQVLHEGEIRHAYITTTGYAIFDSAEIPMETNN